MIYSVTGKIIHIEDGVVVVECGGIGYQIRTTLTTLSNLPKVSEQTTVFTYMHVREDALELFGFSDKKELNCFKMLISINGVGPKAGLAILSAISSESLALAVAGGDYKTLTKAQGVGPKLAQRIVLELKDKVTNEQVSAGITQNVSYNNVASGNSSEAISALVVLGYEQGDVASIVASFDPSLSVEEMIKLALKKLSGQV